MKIIGLSGYARSGKDEAAKILVEEYGYTRVAFADKLREALYALNPLVRADFGFEFRAKWDGPGIMRLQDVIDEFGWESYKESEFGSEIRYLLQRLGTEAGRQTLSDSIWVDAAFANLPEDAKVVITDVRFPNEYDAVRERGGLMWRIERPSVGPAKSADGSVHTSETALDEHRFCYHLWNRGSLEDYRDDIRSVMKMYDDDWEKWKSCFNSKFNEKGERL